eukprot:gene14875-biopygen15699
MVCSAICGAALGGPRDTLRGVLGFRHGRATESSESGLPENESFGPPQGRVQCGAKKRGPEFGHDGNSSGPARQQTCCAVLAFTFVCTFGTTPQGMPVSSALFRCFPVQTSVARAGEDRAQRAAAPEPFCLRAAARAVALHNRVHMSSSFAEGKLFSAFSEFDGQDRCPRNPILSSPGDVISAII